MNVKAKDLMQLMETWAPRALAEKWDHPGLQVGNPEGDVAKVLISLDLTEEAVDFAAKNGISMIISHHPFLFKALRELDLTTYKGRVIGKLIKNDILAFAAHTNLDTAKGGVNDALADALGLENREGLVSGKEEATYKLAIYLRPAVAKAFRGYLEKEYAEETDHYYFLDNDVDMADTVKLEMNVKGAALPSVLQALQERAEGAHYDIYELQNGRSREYMGRIGDLPKEMDGKEALSYIKEKLGIPVLRYAGDAGGKVRRVAVLGGAGSEFAALAKSKGADLYLTGDLKYHEAQDAAALGLLIADGGHFYTERVIVPVLAKRMEEEAKKRGWELEVIAYEEQRDIFEQV